MRALNLAVKDWMQIFRDWKSGIFLVAMPILFTLFFGMVMGSAFSSGTPEDPRLPVGVINQDKSGSLSDRLETLLVSSKSVRHVEMNEEEFSIANKQIDDGEIAAVLRIPPGFSGSLLADQPLTLEVFVDRNTSAGQTAATAIETAVNRIRGVVESAHLSAEQYQNDVGLTSEKERRNYLEEAVALGSGFWEQPPLSTKTELATGAAQVTNDMGELDGFAQASAGMIVQFAIFGLITSAMVLVMERNNKTLARILTTPMTRAEVIAGHMLAMFVVVLLQEALLVLFGQAVYGVNYFREPAGVLLMMVTLALWSASLGLLISSIADGEEQVVTLSLIAMFLFASMGGAWFPLEVAGETFSSIGHVMPTAWAMDGFQNILLRGLGFESVFLPAGILCLYALAFFAIAVWRFDF
jgi:ABC-2 type transport system permease protein